MEAFDPSSVPRTPMAVYVRHVVAACAAAGDPTVAGTRTDAARVAAATRTAPARPGRVGRRRRVIGHSVSRGCAQPGRAAAVSGRAAVRAPAILGAPYDRAHAVRQRRTAHASRAAVIG